MLVCLFFIIDIIISTFRCIFIIIIINIIIIVINMFFPSSPVPPSGRCGSGWIYDSGSNNCFKYSTSELTWPMANDQCHYEGGYLTSITNQAESEFHRSKYKEEVEIWWEIGFEFSHSVDVSLEGCHRRNVPWKGFVFTCNHIRHMKYINFSAQCLEFLTRPIQFLSKISSKNCPWIDLSKVFTIVVIIHLQILHLVWKNYIKL